MTFPPALLGNSEHEGTHVVHDGNIGSIRWMSLFKELFSKYRIRSNLKPGPGPELNVDHASIRILHCARM